MTISTATWHWPQYLILGEALLDVFIVAALDGKPRTGRYNGTLKFLVTTVFLVTLYCGGFFG